MNCLQQMFASLLKNRASCLSLLLLAIVLVVQLPAQNVYIGMPKHELINQLGLPQSKSSLGNKEVLKFSNGARIELRDGIVHEVEGIDFNYEKQIETYELPATEGFQMPKPQPVPEENPRIQRSAESPSEGTGDNPPAPQADNPDALPGIAGQAGAITLPEGAEDFDYDAYVEQLEDELTFEKPTALDLTIKFFVGMVVHIGLMLLLTSIIAQGTGVEIFFMNRLWIAIIHALIYKTCDLVMTLILGAPLVYLNHGLGLIVFLAITPKLTSAQNVNTIMTVSVALTFGFVVLNMIIWWLIAMTGISFLHAAM